MSAKMQERPFARAPLRWRAQGYDMKITFVKPRHELQPYIDSFWVFESPIGFPVTDSSIAAPNGCSKLIIPYENSLVSVANGRVQVSHEQRLYFVGNRDSSTLLQSSSRNTGFIAIEFSPHGAFPIFGIPMAETFNGLWEADVVFAKWGRGVQEVLNNLQRVNQKVSFIQDQLTLLLRKKDHRNGLVEYCVQSLRSADGRISIQELVQKTGYSRRYLDLLFKQHVGLTPKVLAGIFHFQKFYRKWAEGQSFDLLKEDLYEYYYDQSHFTKEFRKMTGYSPRKFSREVSNEFGRRLVHR
jgi:AraC-like DNA-binding protein